MSAQTTRAVLFTVGVAGVPAIHIEKAIWLCLECIRDELAERMRSARGMIAQRADEQPEKRLVLERMLLDPAAHRFARVSCIELGSPGCGVWQVRPRLGLMDADGLVAGQALLWLPVSPGLRLTIAALRVSPPALF